MKDLQATCIVPRLTVRTGIGGRSVGLDFFVEPDELAQAVRLSAHVIARRLEDNSASVHDGAACRKVERDIDALLHQKDCQRAGTGDATQRVNNLFHDDGSKTLR